MMSKLCLSFVKYKLNEDFLICFLRKSSEIITHSLESPSTSENDDAEKCYEKTYDAINSYVFDDLMKFFFQRKFAKQYLK